MEQVEQLELKQFKQTDKLTKAVLALTKRYEIADKKQIARDKLSLKDRLKEGVKSKLAEKFSLKNIGSLMGMGAGTMIGDFLGDRHDAKVEEKKKAANEVQKAAEFAKNNAKYNPESVANKTQAEGIAHGVKLYKEQERILLEIKKIEEEISSAKETGHEESAKEFHKNTLKELNLQLEIIRGNKSEVTTNNKSNKESKTDSTTESKMEKTDSILKVEKETNNENNTETNEKEISNNLTVAEQIENGHDTVNELVQIRDVLMERGDVVEAAIAQLESDTGKTITVLEKEHLISGIKVGMDEELLKLNEEQLNALRELVGTIRKKDTAKPLALEKNADNISPLQSVSYDEEGNPVNLKQKTNTELAKKKGFESVGAHYNDMMTRQESSDPEVVKQAEDDLKLYQKNIESDTKELLETNKESVTELSHIRENLIERDAVNSSVEKLDNETATELKLEKTNTVTSIDTDSSNKELLELNKEQLAALRELVANSKINEEDKLEAKKNPSLLQSTDPKTGAKKEEKKGGILDKLFNVMDLLKKGPAGILSALAPNVLKTAASAVPAIARGAAVGGSIIKGGSSLIKGGISLANSGIAKLSTVGTGAANAASTAVKAGTSAASSVGTVANATSAATKAGTGIASTVGSITKGAVASVSKGAGALGSVAAKAGPLGAALDVGMGVNDLLKGKAQEEMPSGWDVISPMKWGMYAGNKINKGVESATGGSSIGSMLGDTFKSDAEKKLDAQMAKEKSQPTVSKVKSTLREEQAKKLDETVRREARIDEQRKAAVASNTAAPTIVSNQTINTTKKSMVLAPPVRNFEPSYNQRLTRGFAS